MFKKIQKYFFDKEHLLLSAGRGLCGQVAPQLRACTVDFDINDKVVVTRAFYDGEVTDHLFDLISCAAAEIEPRLEPQEPHSYNDIIIRLDYPEKIPFEGNLIYLRYEPDLEGQYPKLQCSERSKYPRAVLFLDMQNALLAKVTPALREVFFSLDIEKKTIDFYFFYDGEISELEYGLVALAVQEGIVSFPYFSIHTHIEQIDFPRRIVKPELQRGDTGVVYARYEVMKFLIE